MTENSLIIREALARGLRQTGREERNVPVLVDCVNLRPSPFGLAPFEPVAQAVSDDELAQHSITVAWPFPQIFRLRKYTYVFTQTGLWLLNETTGDLTGVGVYDAALPASPALIPAGGTWHIADFQDHWVATNAECVLYRNTTLNKVLVRGAVVRSLCECGGRLFVGGLDQLWSSAWQTLLNTWVTKAPASFNKTITGTPENLVFWTNVGNLLLFYMLFDTELAKTGPLSTHSTASPLVRELMLRGDWGFAAAPFQGKVLALKRLGHNAVAVYGEQGAALFTPVSSPAPSCSVRALHNIGLYSRSAVAGNDQQHVWVDKGRNLWVTTAEGRLERLDFEEFGDLMTGPTIVAAHDAQENDFFVSDGSTSFTLVQGARLAKAPQCVTSVVPVNGSPAGFFVNTASQDAAAVVNCYDFGVRGQKTVDSIRVAGSWPNNTVVKAGVYWRNSPSAAWTKDAGKRLNDEGAADDIHCTADQFRVYVEASPYNNVHLSEIEVCWRHSDRRFTSGQKARSAILLEA